MNTLYKNRIITIAWGMIAMSFLIIMVKVLAMSFDNRNEQKCLGTEMRTECIDGFAYAFKFFSAYDQKVMVLVPLWSEEGKPKKCEVYSDFDKFDKIPEK